MVNPKLAVSSVPLGDPQLAARLRREIEGDVLFDAFARGRYSTDASIYQIEPIGVVVPRNEADIQRIVDIARDASVPLLARGAGSSQCGQTVGRALVVDTSKYLNRIVAIDADRRTALVQPGVVMDELNNTLREHGLMFPVDISTGSRATLGGMAGNNSCGTRSIVYGPMRDNVVAIEAMLADGQSMHFGPIDTDLSADHRSPRSRELTAAVLALGAREADEIKQRFPDLMRRVGGYNIDALLPDHGPHGVNLAHLLVGSEGTLAISTRLQLQLHPIPAHRVLGVCHFPTFYDAMSAARHLVELGPSAVELVDRTMIELSRDIPMFGDTVDRFVQGKPDALLLVEFAGDDRATQLADLRRLGEYMAQLGFPGGVVEAVDAGFQQAIWNVRKAGLNIMMSMKGDGKPVSFIEDCAVRLDDLAEYTQRLTEVFRKHGTTGTWYAHASVGCLHVRPVLNLKLETDAVKMRAIAEEAFAMVREYKGSHSGEHGDGLVRSEFHGVMFGERMVRNFEELKALFDPEQRMNPGKIVDPPRMDDRSLFRFKPGYRIAPITTALDWSQWGGIGAAVEMCNNNGACRNRDVGVMCPSYRATGNERDLTRGRANSLRLALSGQLGPDALTTDAMRDTMELCVGCKGCRRECPTGVDMAKMKIEFQYQYQKRHGRTLRDRLIGFLPRYAPVASRFGTLLNLRNRWPWLASRSEAWTGFSARRGLPAWHPRPFNNTHPSGSAHTERDVILFVDTFNRYFEPDNVHAAIQVLRAAGYNPSLAAAGDGDRPLCCGRTFLSVGMVDEARAEARRTLAALQPHLQRGTPVLGLEPSCLFTFRDEYPNLLPPQETSDLARHSYLFEEFLAREYENNRYAIRMPGLRGRRALLHGHCHQKAFAVMPSVQAVLGQIDDLTVHTIVAGCCGMAGAFGFGAGTYDVSMQIAELDLLPQLRTAEAETIIIADGTSCRQQIYDGVGRRALHVARVMQQGLADVATGVMR
ncbi:MAG: FAD-binding protein [Gammaproteobacteria bacterium]|nr:FAD-binding protein [Gammaproteobacteria bacterium]MDH3464753.1 FAD-binding protein [Gammaproteobacteria bacterium]